MQYKQQYDMTYEETMKFFLVGLVRFENSGNMAIHTGDISIDFTIVHYKVDLLIKDFVSSANYVIMIVYSSNFAPLKDILKLQ